MLAPVGPLPPSVYWRRRAAALAVALGVVALGVWGLVALVGGGDGSSVLADTRPASFAAAEQEHRERARESAETSAAAPPPAPSPAPAPAPLPPSEDPSAALLAPPSGAARALLPGAVLGTTPPPAPSPPSDPAPPDGTTPAPGVPTPPAAEPDPGASAPADPAVPAPQAAAPAPPCPDASLTVTAGTDKTAYSRGERPGFSLEVTNTGDVACSRDLGAARQAIAVVRTPGDGLWSSDDCSSPTAAAPDVRRLAPGESATFASSWSGRTSLPGCRAPRDVVPPGDYQLLARLDTMISEPVRFALG